MKRVVLNGLIFIVLLSFSNCKKSDEKLLYNKSYIKEIKELRKQAILFLSRNYVPGGSFAVAKDGKIIYSEAMGYASKDLEVLATRKTKFRIGAVTELFTSLAYQRLIEEGILHSDSSIHYYYPDFPKKEFRITLDNLVNHSSGIRPAYKKEETDMGLNKSLKKSLDFFKNDPLGAAPNYMEQISMFNYNLLGLAMEKATGKHFNNIIGEEVIDTLHLENTVFENPYKTIKDRSNHFEHNFIAQVTEGISSDLRFAAPHMGLLSNAEDLVKLGNAMLESDYITDEMKNRMFTLRMLDSKFKAQMSNGWFIGKTKEGLTYYARAGSVTGGGSALLIYPEQKLVVAAAINLTIDSENIPISQMADPFVTKPSATDKENKED